MVTLIRHAAAEDAVEDSLRPLSVSGRAATRRLAEFLKRSGALQGTEVWHSSLVRARQTAEVLAEKIGRQLSLREVDGLAPEDPPEVFARRLEGMRKHVIVVGHNPHLTTLASILVKGDPQSAVVLFEKCAAVALEDFGCGNAGDWVVAWHIAPELLKAAE